MDNAASRVLCNPDLLGYILVHLDDDAEGLHHLRRLREVCSGTRHAFDEIYFSSQPVALRADLLVSSRRRAAATLRASLARLMPRCTCRALALGLRCCGADGQAPDLSSTLCLTSGAHQAALGSSLCGLQRLELRLAAPLVAEIARVEPCLGSLAHLAVELVPWREAERLLGRPHPSGHPLNQWRLPVDEGLAQLLAPLTSLQSFSLEWARASKSSLRLLGGGLSLSAVAPSLPPSLTSLRVTLGRRSMCCGGTLRDLTHLTALQQLTLVRALAQGPVPGGGGKQQQQQGVPPSLSRLTSLHLAARCRRQAALPGLAASLAALPLLRHLAVGGGLLGSWPQALPSQLTWLELECRGGGPPEGYSWQQVAPALRHLALLSFRERAWEGPVLAERQQLDLAALSCTLRSLECAHVRLGSSAAGGAPRALCALGCHLTSLALHACDFAAGDGQEQQPAGEQQQHQQQQHHHPLVASLASLWQLREMRLSDSQHWPLPWQQLGYALTHLHALTRLHLDCNSHEWRRPLHTLRWASLPSRLRHLECSHLRLPVGLPGRPAAPLPAALCQLTALVLNECELPGLGALPLLPAACTLRHLSLWGCWGAGLDGMACTLRHLSRLTSLDLSHVTCPKYRTLPCLDLRRLTKLRQAFVGWCPRVAPPAAAAAAGPAVGAPAVLRLGTISPNPRHAELAAEDEDYWWRFHEREEGEGVEEGGWGRPWWDGEELEEAEAEEADVAGATWASGRYAHGPRGNTYGVGRGATAAWMPWAYR